MTSLLNKIWLSKNAPAIISGVVLLVLLFIFKSGSRPISSFFENTASGKNIAAVSSSLGQGANQYFNLTIKKTDLPSGDPTFSLQSVDIFEANNPNLARMIDYPLPPPFLTIDTYDKAHTLLKRYHMPVFWVFTLEDFGGGGLSGEAVVLSEAIDDAIIQYDPRVARVTVNNSGVETDLLFHKHFSGAEKAKLRALSPRANEVINAGALITVRWTRGELPEAIPVRLSLFRGRATTTVSTNAPMRGITTPNDGSEEFIVPPGARPGFYFFEFVCKDAKESCAPFAGPAFNVVGSEARAFMSVDLKVNGTDKPAPLKRKSTITLSWKRLNVGNCFANWSMGSSAIKSDGTFETVFDSARTKVYEIVCYSEDLKSQVRDSVAVTPL